MEKLNLLNGNNLELLKTLEDNSVDSIVTDPPYGLSFMNKKWDYDVPSTDFWKEVLRVLKPGGHVLSFGGTRTYHRMVVNMEDAGFEIRDQIMWLYGSGFPKSHNIGKAIDKLQGNEREVIGDNPNQIGKYKESEWAGNTTARGIFRNDIEQKSILTKGNSDYEGWGTALKPANEPICLARKPIEENTIAENVIKYGTGGINIDGCRIESYNNEHFRGYVNDVDTGNANVFIGNLGFQPTNSELGRFPANIILDEDAGKVLDEQSGGVIKPANEPICLARKPISENTIAENVIKWGTGGINIDDCRIATDDKLTRTNVNGFNKQSIYSNFNKNDSELNGSELNGDYGDRGSVEGRFPANLILDETAAELLDEQSGKSKSVGPKQYDYDDAPNQNNPTKLTKNIKSGVHFSDKGGASRFFYSAKVGKKERNMGLDGFEDKTSQLNSGGIGRKTSVEKRLDTNGENAPTAKNTHPTIKPVQLMAYLCRLITPKGGTVLDPFMGSGSTGIAALLEGFNFIGMEMDENYFNICESRINNYEEYRQFLKK